MKTILITGATSGIGEALANHAASRGYQVIACGRNQEKLDMLAKHQNIQPLQFDVTDKQATQSALADVRFDIAVLNAGTCEYLEIAHYNSDVIEKNIHTNVIGTARCLDIALPALRRSRAKGQPATLVIVSSSAWWFPFGRAEGYGASKAALTYFAHALRADLDAEGIDVVVVSPGFVKTPLTDRNDFPMPFLVSAEDAAERIVSGLARGKNEIAFPKRFTWMLKALGALPQPLIDRMSASMARKSNTEQENNG